MAYGELKWSAAGGQHCVELVEVAVSNCLSSYNYYYINAQRLVQSEVIPEHWASYTL